jgi:hypothetical protein
MYFEGTWMDVRCKRSSPIGGECNVPFVMHAPIARSMCYTFKVRFYAASTPVDLRGLNLGVLDECIDQTLHC